MALADDHDDTVVAGDRHSFLVRVLNRSKARIGSLGDEAWVLGYRVPGLEETSGEPRRITRLTQDLFPGVTFHVLNVGAEWPGISRRTYRCCADLWSPRVGWMGGGVEVQLNLDPLSPRYSATPEEGVDFSRPGFPGFLQRAVGLSIPEARLGRWSDEREYPCVALGFEAPLPRRFTLEVECLAFGPNIGAAASLHIGGSRMQFVPNGETGLHRFEVSLDGPASEIRIIPPKPTSPAELGLSSDVRRLGICFQRLRVLE